MRAGQPFARSVFITFAASGFEVCRRKGDVGTEPMREGSAPTGSSRSGRSQRRCRYSADAGRYQKLGAHLERAGRKGDVGA